MKKNINKKIIQSLFLITCLVSNANASSDIKIINNKIRALELLISKSEIKGLDAEREKMTIHTAKIFLAWSDWDEKNTHINEKYYAKHPIYKKNSAQLAINLPNDERASVDELLTAAITELTKVIAGSIRRKPLINVDYKKVHINDGVFKIDETPVFLSDYTWKHKTPALTKYFGDLNGTYLAPSYVIDEDGNVDKGKLASIQNSNKHQIGQTFISHDNMPTWINHKYHDFKDGQRHYGKYDIDHPAAKKIYADLFKHFVPALKDKRSTGLGYMLFNEPSFFTQKDVWNSGIVSFYTHQKFKKWLAVQHKSINQLNSLWKSNYNSFDNISIDIPIDNKHRGTPMWYDWMRFNQVRVTDWFQFLNDEIEKYDENAKTHIKLMPWLWNENKRDHGIDFEALLEQSEIIGFDAKSFYSHIRNKKYSWMKNSAYDWQSTTMTFDFFSSVQPKQILWDSENHFFTNVIFMEKDVNIEYLRSIFWLATSHGLSGTSTWVWGRDADGSALSRNIGGEYIVDVTHQPKGLHQITRSYMEMNANSKELVALQKLAKPIRIFYSETSAINQSNYMDKIRKSYLNNYFTGIPLGFATENIISKQDNKWPIIVVTGSSHVKTSEIKALQNFINQGGVILIDENSLKYDQYGRPQTKKITGNLAQVIKFSSEQELARKLLILTNDKKLKPAIEVVEKNIDNNTKASIAWRVAKYNSTNYALLLVNTGKKSKIVQLKSIHNVKYTDNFTGKELKSNLSIPVNGTLFINASF